MIKFMRLSLFISIMMCCCFSAFASKVALLPDSSHPQARGMAYVFDGYFTSENILKFQIKGLRPNGVYSVWFISGDVGQPIAGVGKNAAPYAFVADAAGRGIYSAVVNTSDLKQWGIVRIVRHKDGNTSNMDVQNIETALTLMVGRLKVKSTGAGVFEISRRSLMEEK